MKGTPIFCPAPRITVASVNRKFSCAKARRDFGYEPAVPMDEALRRTLAHFAHLSADKWQQQQAAEKAKKGGKAA